MLWPDGSPLRAAWWAFTELVRVRRSLPQLGLRMEVSNPPQLPNHALFGVRVVMRLGRATCLERALIIQRWKSAHGDAREVIIGVANSGELTAHAWIDGEHPQNLERFAEIIRLPLTHGPSIPPP